MVAVAAFSLPDGESEAEGGLEPQVEVPRAGRGASSSHGDPPGPSLPSNRRDRSRVPDLTWMRGARILVVEDDQLARRTIERVLRIAGCETLCVSSAEDAMHTVSVLPTGGVDGAVVDLCLRDGRGGAIVSALRERDWPCCALIISGSQEVGAPREAFDAGADDFLSKPFDAQQLLDAVAKTIGRTRRWREQMASRAERAPAASLHQELTEAAIGDLALAELQAAAAAAAAVMPAPPPVLAPVSPPALAPAPAQAQATPLGGQESADSLGLVDFNRCTDELVRRGHLSKREREIVELMLRGASNQEIAKELGTSERTAKFHVSNVLKKLNMNSRAQILRLLF